MPTEQTPSAHYAKTWGELRPVITTGAEIMDQLFTGT
jgi:hypothetical protein